MIVGMKWIKRGTMTLMALALFATSGMAAAQSLHVTEEPPMEDGIVSLEAAGQGEQAPSPDHPTDAVVLAQAILAKLGFYADNPDGLYNSKTQALITALQRSKGLEVTGQLDDQTRETLALLDELLVQWQCVEVDPAAVLGLGDRGYRVEAVNSALSLRGLLHEEEVDAFFSLSTQQAMMDFERVCGYEVDGVVDAQEYAVLTSTLAVTLQEGEEGLALSEQAIMLATTNTQTITGVQKISWWGSDGMLARWPRDSYATVIDCMTGITMRMKHMRGTNHADVEPATKTDTALFKQTYGGRWSWARRPVWVIIDGVTYAGSINGMPHSNSSIKDNGMDGQVCLHFLGSRTHDHGSVCPDHQHAVQLAYEMGNQ